MLRPTSNIGKFVECLEDRRLFAVAIAMPAADTLVFTGNFQNDQVYIYDNGTGTMQGWVSNAVGALVPFGPVPGIRNVHVDTGDGNDTVAYTVTGDMWPGGMHTLGVKLGTGDDTFRYYAGNDIDIWANENVYTRVFGDKGNDLLSYFHRGEVDGKVSLTMDGFEGHDRLITDEKFDAGSTGSFSTRSYAGAGKDRVDLLVRKSNPFDPIAITAFAHSGADADWDELTRTALATDDGLFNVVNVIP